MSTKAGISRMTIDISAEDHRRLKALAAVLGKSMGKLSPIGFTGIYTAKIRQMRKP